MNEALKSTAVKPNNEIEEKSVIALYELAGFKTHEGFYNYSNLPWIGIGYSSEIVRWVNEPKMNTITLDQLAWDYDLAPEWATELIVNDGSFYFTDKHKITALSLCDKTVIGGVAIDKLQVISTRPQQEWMPEVGEECLVKDDGEWEKTRIVGFDSKGRVVCETPWDEDFEFDAFEDKPELFKPLPTPEEVEREEFIKEFWDDLRKFKNPDASGVASTNCAHLKAAYMFDLGYRKITDQS